MKQLRALLMAGLSLALGAGLAAGEPTYSWRYFRPGNTGIQGDWNEAIWIGPDGDPWIGGYEPNFEEGGFSKFVQAENRWVNYSNVDYPVIGHPDETGVVRVSDILADDHGNLWFGTLRGALRMNPMLGPSSLVRFGPGNSALPGGSTNDLTRAPDGTIWISAESSVWGGGGLTRFNPATNQWSHINGHGGLEIAAQAKPGGGYYLWATGAGFSPMERWNSSTQAWNSYPATAGNPAHLVSLDSVDDEGNVWMTRWIGDQGQETLDCLRPDGTWVTPPLPPMHPQVGVVALRAFGAMQALLINGYADLYRFNGSTWSNLGPVPNGGFFYDLDIDAAGNIWTCASGQGGALRRDAETGFWQHYRITNTGNCDNFNGDLAIDPVNGYVYATANASPGVGGMTRFDGVRWVSWNPLTYGLGYDWPFLTDNCQAIATRSGRGEVVVSPADWLYGIHEWDGTGFSALPGLDGATRLLEDSLGRLWAQGGTTTLSYWDGASWTLVPGIGGGGNLKRDPDRPGSVWAANPLEIMRTDGVDSFQRTIEDFPGSAQTFTGLAVEPGGIAWIGTWTQFTSGGSTLIRLDADTDTYQTWQYDAGWPFPGEHVRPLLVTPDGRLWMLYDSEYPSTEMGLCWYDGVNVGNFPAPPGGIPQWGGFPHASLNDIEMRPTPNGYELWMSFGSRGIAALSVEYPDPTSVTPSGLAADFRLEPSTPNPFRAATTLSFALPNADRVQIGVYDVQGRRIRDVLDDRLAGGRSAVTWDGKDNAGRSAVSGVYFWRLKTTSGEATQRMLLLR